MNKVVVKKDENITLFAHEFDTTYDVYENALLVVYDYKFNESSNVIINLLGENATVEYHYSTINYDNNSFIIVVNHLANKTVSNIYNHGVNVLNNQLVFDVTGDVSKKYFGCVVNQKNQIINLNDGNSEIKPNLLIENYDVSSTHSAYIGKFKDDLLFYLNSRGISKKNALKLLMRAFLLNGGNQEDKVVKDFLEKLQEV